MKVWKIGSKVIDLPGLEIELELGAKEFLSKFYHSNLQIDNSLDAVVMIDNNYQSGVEGVFSRTEIPVIRVGNSYSYRKVQNSWFGFFQSPLFDGVFNEFRVKKYPKDIKKFIDDFNMLRSSEINCKDDVIDLLRSPDDLDLFYTLNGVIPPLEKINTKRLASWIINRFLSTPGNIVGSKRASIICGMKLETFNRNKQKFSEYRYDGIFSDYVGERWWFNQLEKTDNELRCSVCGRKGIDTFAYMENNCEGFTTETIEPVHYKCSNIFKARATGYMDLREAADKKPGDSKMDKLF